MVGYIRLQYLQFCVYIYLDMCVEDILVAYVRCHLMKCKDYRESHGSNQGSLRLHHKFLPTGRSLNIEAKKSGNPYILKGNLLWKDLYLSVCWANCLLCSVHRSFSPPSPLMSADAATILRRQVSASSTNVF